MRVGISYFLAGSILHVYSFSVDSILAYYTSTLNCILSKIINLFKQDIKNILLENRYKFLAYNKINVRKVLLKQYFKLYRFYLHNMHENITLKKKIFHCISFETYRNLVRSMDLYLYR